MAVSVGDIIKAADYNGIQAKVEKVLGTSENTDPTFGYGQAVNSSPVTALSDPSVPNGDSVTADQVNNLLDDLGVIFKHQTGNNETTPSFAIGEIIGANSSGSGMTYNTDGSVAINDEDVAKGINDLETLIDNLTASRFDMANSQSETVTAITDSRTRDWNNTVISEFTVSFSSELDRRHFFNAGGEIRIEGTVDLSTSTGNSLSRDQGWNALLENVSTVIFDHSIAVDTGNAAGVSRPNGNIGNYQLTSSYQTVFRKDASSGVYSDSFWFIEARENSSSEISFRVNLVDSGPESDSDSGSTGSVPGGINEPITADLTFDYGYRRADGPVVVATPVLNIVEDFDLNLNVDPVVATPSNQSPNNNQIVPTNMPFSLTSSAFNVLNGSDTHESTQWFVKKTNESFDNPIVYTESTSDLTSIELEPALFDDVRGSEQDYEWYVRYKGANLGWTPWSSGTTFTSSVYAEFNITLDSDQESYILYDNIRDQFNWNGTQRLQGTVTVASGVIIGSTDTSTYAFTVDRIPANSIVTMQNNGRITGAGGKGGRADTTPDNGSSGGPALRVTDPITVQNGNGIITGGGGGGGAAYAEVGTRDQNDHFASGGGGAGFYSGARGDAIVLGAGGTDLGEDGTLTSGGAGGESTTTTTFIGTTATGGAGGGPGQSGENGSSTDGPASNGGSAGNAIVGISNISFASGSGNVLGPTS